MNLKLYEPDVITQCPHCETWNQWHSEFKYCSKCGRTYEVDTTYLMTSGEVI